MRHVILTVLLLLVTVLPGYSDGGKLLVTMRQIGHEVLLASGDSTSWVSPIEDADDRTFLIRFQRPFAFKPSSLVEIIHWPLPQNQESLDYLVEVRQEKLNTVVYSYEIRQPIKWGVAWMCLFLAYEKKSSPPPRYALSTVTGEGISWKLIRIKGQGRVANYS